MFYFHYFISTDNHNASDNTKQYRTIPQHNTTDHTRSMSGTKSGSVIIRLPATSAPKSQLVWRLLVVVPPPFLLPLLWLIEASEPTDVSLQCSMGAFLQMERTSILDPVAANSWNLPRTLEE